MLRSQKGLSTLVLVTVSEPGELVVGLVHVHRAECWPAPDTLEVRCRTVRVGRPQVERIARLPLDLPPEVE